MTKNALTCAAVITAYILGIATGILAVKNHLERKYKKRSDEEINSVKDAFEERLKKQKKRSAEESDKIDEIYTRLLEQARYKSQEEPEQSVDDDESGPIVIPPDEYGDNLDYRSYSITYYEADGAFTNEFDEPLDYNEWRNMLGSDILRHRGEYEEDRICVRNDKKRAYYELLLEEGECET